MAVRKSSDDGGAKKSSGGKMLKGFGSFFRILGVLFWFLLGGLIFNLDRAGDFGVFLLKHKQIIPYPFSRFLPGAGVSAGSARPEQLINARVIEVYDGDTATVLTAHPEVKYKVRFFGIDAPEIAMKHGKEAKAALQDKILGKDVIVKVVNVDRYSRAVGKIMLGARYINSEMVAEGHAWHYSDYAKDEYDLAAAEKTARAYRIGLWQDSNPVQPWEYRSKNK